MRKPNHLLKLSVVVFGILLMASCNNASKPPEAGAAASDTLAKVVVDTPNKSLSKIEGVFNNLWIESTKFLLFTDPKKEKKITFKYFVKEADSLTLQGYLNDKDSTKFNKDTLTLWVGRAGGYNIARGSNFSNQVLTKEAIEIIRDTIKKSKGKYVVFIPNLGDDDLIEYKILVIDSDPMAFTKADFSKKEFLALPNTNPSPPRGSN